MTQTNCECCTKEVKDIFQFYGHKFCKNCSHCLTEITTKIGVALAREFIANRNSDMPIKINPKSLVGISKIRLYPNVTPDSGLLECIDLYNITVRT